MKLVIAEEEFILFLAEFYPSWQRFIYLSPGRIHRKFSLKSSAEI